MRARIRSAVRWFVFGVADKTSWEWMELLLIPLFLAVGAFFLERQTEQRQEYIVQEQAKQEALTSYFEQMQELLLSENLRRSPEDSEVRSVARAITTTTIKEVGRDTSMFRDPAIFSVLRYLSRFGAREFREQYRDLSGRSGLLISFLQESNLIQNAEATVDEAEDKPLFLLAGLNLKFTDLIYVDLNNADLSGADLTSSILGVADLSNADLSEAILYDADLTLSNLRSANLSGADLHKANLVEPT